MPILKKVTPSEVAAVAPKTMYLYRVTCRRTPPTGKEITTRMRTFVTFGTSEDDAKDRIWSVYEGSSFDKEFDRENASVEFLIGGVLKVGGN